MKKLFAIAFVSLFLLHFAGVYTYFGVRLMAIHQEMKAKLKTLPQEQLERIILSKKDFNKINLEEDELELNGKMYDIAQIEEKGNEFIIYALHDESEDSLLGLLDEMVKRSSNDKKPVPSQFLQFLSLVFISSQHEFHFGRTFDQKHFSFYSNLYFSFRPSIEVPPPKV
jgi:hypothetical protein